MTTLALAVLGWLVVVILGKFASEEAIAWSKRWQSWVLRRSAATLPQAHKDRYLQEWLAELEAIPNGPITRSAWVLKILIGTREMSHALGGPLRMRRLDILIKRTQDIVLGVALLVLLSPTLLIICIAIKLTSRGPVFFRQDRIGLEGKPFRMIKFRTMKVATHQMPELADGRPTFYLKSAPSVTMVGYFLRRFSIDELPQIFNVLMGQMSLVGPRPHFISEEPQSPTGAGVSVKPGLTGIWSMNGAIEMTDLEAHRYYVENWSTKTDLLTFLKTIRVVVSTSSLEGPTDVVG